MAGFIFKIISIFRSLVICSTSNRFTFETKIFQNFELTKNHFKDFTNNPDLLFHLLSFVKNNNFGKLMRKLSGTTTIQTHDILIISLLPKPLDLSPILCRKLPVEFSI